MFNSKYELVEKCFNSFLKALAGISYELAIILDGCPEEYVSIFKRRVDSSVLKIIRTPAIGNASTFLAQISLLLNKAHSDHVYFAEDDYYYIAGLKEALDFIAERNNIVDFITPYDHPEYYTNPTLHGYEKLTIRYGARTWKEVGSTTCTFMTSKKVLHETCKILTQYPVLWDYFMFNTLTRRNSLLSYHYMRYIYVKRVRLAILLRLRNLGSRKYRLWAPTPTIATHLHKNVLSPKFDWVSTLERDCSTTA
jgi:hypothetical protein